MRHRFPFIAALASMLVLLFAVSALAKSGDVNRDKIPDRWEKKHGLSLKVKQASKDQDRDGVDNLCEYQAGTDPLDSDTDNDKTEDADEDADHDKVDNGNEADEETDCDDADTDNDGKRDGVEDADKDHMSNASEDRTGNDPDDADTDNDGVKDGDEQAGVIQSFTDGTLVIKLADGTLLTGKVDARTEIECETEDEHEVKDESKTVSKSSGDDDKADSDERADSDRDGVEDREEGDDDDRCSVTDLVAGVLVHEAETATTDAGVVFREIEIIK